MLINVLRILYSKKKLVMLFLKWPIQCNVREQKNTECVNLKKAYIADDNTEELELLVF